MTAPSTRILSLAGPEEGTSWRLNLHWFRLFLLLHMGSRSFLNFPGTPLDSEFDKMLYAVTIMTAFAGAVPRFTLWAVRIGAVLVFTQLLSGIVQEIDTANHVFLEGVLLAFFAFCAVEDDDEATLLMQCIRWTIAVFFFYTGFQKLVYGYYFDGSFLAYVAATEERFELVFSPLIPAAELERLKAFNTVLLSEGRWQVGIDAGPYRVDAPLFVAMSNLVYVFEMLAGILLLVRKVRPYVAISVILFVVMIEAGAREITFGALMINAAFLYMRGPWVKRLFPAFVVMYLYLIFAEEPFPDLLPMFWYSPA